MATYVMTDIHGRLDALKCMLEKINFNKSNDTLYFLGDYCDWGDKSIGVIQFLMNLQKESNVICLMGNHDKMMLKSISKPKKILEGYMQSILYDDDISLWYYNGGYETYLKYRELSSKERLEIKQWLRGLKWVIPDLEVNNRKFYLCHAAPYVKGMTYHKVIWERLYPNEFIEEDMKKWGLEDKTIICGHTIVKKFRYLLMEQNRERNISNFVCKILNYKDKIIYLDCGAKVLERDYASLSCLCLDTMEEYYVDYSEVVEFKNWM